MADDSKNQDPEEEKNQSPNDDDFGLSDFEFDELEDDDDDEPVSPPEEKAPAEVPSEISAKDSEESGEGVPGMDAGDLEGIDLEGIADVDSDNLDDLGDLGALDLEDLDLEDLDKNLADIDEEIAVTTGEAPLVGASADKIEDIFEEVAKDEKEDSSTEAEAPVGEIEDDVFYEEEPFEDFDLDESAVAESTEEKSADSIKEEVTPVPEAKEEKPEPVTESDTPDELEVDLGDIEETGAKPDMDLATALDDSGLDMNLGDTLDDSDLLDLEEEDSIEPSTFDGDGTGPGTNFGDGLAYSSVFEEDETPDVEFEGVEEGNPFAKRPVEGADGLAETAFNPDGYSDRPEEEVAGAKSKFVKIVVIGTVLFVAMGFGFLYLNDSIPFGDGTEESEKVAKTGSKMPTKKPTAKKETEKAANADTKKATGTKKTETKPVKATPKKTNTKPPKKTTTQAKKQATSTAGVTTLSAKARQSHLVVGSFGDGNSAQTYASRLVAQGESVTIIPPFGSSSNHRVSVASFASWSLAETNLKTYRDKFGSGVWILKY